MKNVTCTKCGWVHFGVTRKHAENEVAKFNAYYDTLTPKQQADYYHSKKASILVYERCHFCGGSYKDMRPFREGDCPDGVTIGPIIDPETEHAQAS